MENNVVSLETAMKLKTAGFLQETYFQYTGPLGDSDKYDTTIGVTRPYQFDIAAPTAQEIADQLGVGVEVSYADHNYPDRKPVWGAFYQGGSKTTGDTMAEALAALWLEVKGNIGEK